MTLFASELRVEIVDEAAATEALGNKPLPHNSADFTLETLQALLRLQQQAHVVLTPTTPDRTLQQLLDDLALDKPLACGDDSGLDNIIAYERNWKEYPDFYDFVDRDDELGQLKTLERELYFDILAPFLEELPENAVALDAGCGVGRFTTALLDRDMHVTAVETSPNALLATVRHAIEHGADAESFVAHLADVRRLPLPEDHFDLTMAMEVICYQTDPSISLRELVRVTKPGGLLVISVEGRHGGIVNDKRTNLKQVRQALCHGILHLPQEFYVSYFTEADLRGLSESLGLSVMHLTGTHYVPDGVLHHTIEDLDLADPKVRREIIETDRLCAQDPNLRPLARGWLAVCRKEN